MVHIMLCLVITWGKNHLDIEMPAHHLLYADDISTCNFEVGE